MRTCVRERDASCLERGFLWACCALRPHTNKRREENTRAQTRTHARPRVRAQYSRDPRLRPAFQARADSVAKVATALPSVFTDAPAPATPSLPPVALELAPAPSPPRVFAMLERKTLLRRHGEASEKTVGYDGGNERERGSQQYPHTTPASTHQNKVQTLM